MIFKPVKRCLTMDKVHGMCINSRKKSNKQQFTKQQLILLFNLASLYLLLIYFLYCWIYSLCLSYNLKIKTHIFFLMKCCQKSFMFWWYIEYYLLIIKIRWILNETNQKMRLLRMITYIYSAWVQRVVCTWKKSFNKDVFSFDAEEKFRNRCKYK